MLATRTSDTASLTCMKDDTSAVFMVLRLAGPTLGALLATLLALALLPERCSPGAVGGMPWRLRAALVGGTTRLKLGCRGVAGGVVMPAA